MSKLSKLLPFQKVGFIFLLLNIIIIIVVVLGSLWALGKFGIPFISDLAQNLFETINNEIKNVYNTIVHNDNGKTTGDNHLAEAQAQCVRDKGLYEPCLYYNSCSFSITLEDFPDAIPTIRTLSCMSTPDPTCSNNELRGEVSLMPGFFGGFIFNDRVQYGLYDNYGVYFTGEYNPKSRFFTFQKDVEFCSAESQTAMNLFLNGELSDFEWSNVVVSPQ